MFSICVDSFSKVALILILTANWNSVIDEVDASVEDSVVVVEESDVDAVVDDSAAADDSVVVSPRQPLLERTRAISIRAVVSKTPPVFIVCEW